MDVAVINSRALAGINSPHVVVEVHLSRGLPSLSIVGLPETAVKESKERVRSAILTNHFEFPLHRITVNLAPADLPKQGGRYDLAIALGILAASKQINQDKLQDYEFIGELALTGELRPVKGILPIAKAIRDAGRELILPKENAAEAALIEDLAVYPATHLLDVCAHLNNKTSLKTHNNEPTETNVTCYPDFADIIAQHQAKRALTIAAAGGHNLLMIGPPGSGKTMLAERLPGLLSDMSENESLETAAIHSVSSQGFELCNWKRRPFRTPHHTASAIALVGGSSHPKPGEISLAHNGILFLDELPEFDRKVLEVLREPLESKRIMISRAAQHTEFPANFQLIAAMNPCPCGYLGDSHHHCSCSAEQIYRYRNKISGPLLDRIDMHIEVPNMSKEILQTAANKPQQDTTKAVKKNVLAAQQRQWDRANKLNKDLNQKELQKFATLNEQHTTLLQQAITKLGLSMRAIHRIHKVARTIADLDNSHEIATQHLTEAINYRRLDRDD